MNKEILIKYFNNSCSDKEFEEFAGWVNEHALSKEGRKWSFDEWKTFDTDLKDKDKEKYNALLNKIHYEINPQNSEEKDNKTIYMQIISKWLSRAAAILFIPLLGIVFYLLSQNNFQTEEFTDATVDSLEVISPVGSRTVIQLSDGTEVNLNYGSKIKYPRKFTGDTREITLTGEGYFNVSHNPDKPFIMKTESLNVMALGTQFNVQSYSEDNVISTTLVDGKVVIDKKLPNNTFERIGTMVPGQHLKYNTKLGEITSSTKGNINKYIAWTNGEMVFDNTPITEVARELSRKFNVEIEVADDIKDLTYTVTFVDDPLFMVLDLMTETTPVAYKRYPRKKLPDGTYSKLKIRIEKRK